MAKNIKNEQVSYDGPERMDASLERKLRDQKTTLSKNPGFPEKPENESTFEEIIASKRFKDVVEKVKHYTGLDDISGRNAMATLTTMLSRTVQRIVEIEQDHRPTLEQLATDLVVKEMGIPDGAFQYDVKLVPLGGIDQEGMRHKGEEPDEEDIEDNFGDEQDEFGEDQAVSDLEDFMSAMEKFDLEKAKRRFINALIQGASEKGHFMFPLVRNQLNAINPELLNLYGVLMSINDLIYWIMPDEAIEMMGNNAASMTGKEEIDDKTEPPTIRVRGNFFPVLVHELVKGVMEVFGTHGLPDDPKQQEMIMNSTDTLANETWDLRLGPVIWEKFTAAYPSKLYEEDQRHIQHYLFTRFSKLTTDEFFRVAKMILSGNPKGEQYIQRMVDDIIIDLKNRDSNSALGYDDDDNYDDGGYDDGDDPDGDDDMDDFLGSLGISRPK